MAVDWQCFGSGPVGADLGYYALSSREEFDVLLETFLDGAGRAVDAEAVALAARVTAVYSVVSPRRVGAGPGGPGRGGAGREVPPPGRRPAPARAAATVPPDRAVALAQEDPGVGLRVEVRRLRRHHLAAVGDLGQLVQRRWPEGEERAAVVVARLR